MSSVGGLSNGSRVVSVKTNGRVSSYWAGDCNTWETLSAFKDSDGVNQSIQRARKTFCCRNVDTGDVLSMRQGTKNCGSKQEYINLKVAKIKLTLTFLVDSYVTEIRET